jgi:hypothetical protein
MAFGTGTVVTVGGRGVIANRIRNTPSVASPRWVGVGTGATGADRTAAATDTALSTEAETRGEGIESQQTTTETGDTYRVVGVVTATNSRNIDEAGLFNAVSGGTMFLSATFPVVSLSINDSLQLTCNVQVTG